MVDNLLTFNITIMKRILFPTDFSDVATNAFVYALELAKIIDAEIIVLHTFQMPIIDYQYFPQNYSQLFDSFELATFEMFKDEIPKLRTLAEKRNLEHINLYHKLMDGALTSNIKDCIVEEKIDFVVMGTAGASGWKEFFIGTNTGDALTSVSVPLLSVPLEAKYKNINNICFTTRYRDKDIKALQSVLQIAKLMKAEVKCLYVQSLTSDVNEEKIETWKKLFADEQVTFFVESSEYIEETIIEFLDFHEIDILAMANYKRSFFVELFTTHLTEKLSYKTEIPILVIQEQA
ncbi:universal stress protein [Flavobacterium gelidilacus]